MKKAIRNKVFISSYATIIFVVFLAFILNFVGVKATSDYILSSKWDGAGVVTPLEEINYTSKYVNFSEVYLNGHTPIQSEVYVIETAVDLYQFSMLSKGSNNALYLGLNYVLGNNINYNDAANRSLFFTPIGYDIPFTGTFDGQGFEISNLFFAQIMSESEYITVYNEQLVYYSMFSKVGVNGIVRNLGIKNVWMYQPIEWGLMEYASYLIGLNEGLVEYVFVIDDRPDSGLNVDGLFNISGLMSVNKGTFREAYVSTHNVISGAVSVNVSDTPVLTKNLGTIDNIYYDSTLYGGEVIISDPSVPLITSEFQNDINFDDQWFFNDSYYISSSQSLRNLKYPTLKGLKRDSSNNYLIFGANDLIFMTELFKVSSYFRNQKYVIQNDIDFNSISKDAYIAPTFTFAGSFESREINVSGETLYTRVLNQGAVNYYSLIGMKFPKDTLVNNNANYGMFGIVSGTVKNINFVNSSMYIENISEHVLNNKSTIGFISGIIDGGIVENVHVYGDILIQDAKIGYVNIGGLIGEGQGLISSSSFNGSIDGGSHIYNVRADASNIGGLIGLTNNIQIENSVNKANIIGYSYNQTNTSLHNYFGGIIGSGTIDYLNKVINKGDVLSSDKTSKSFNVFIGGIIGKHFGLLNNVMKVNNEGDVELYVPHTMTSRIGGYGVVQGSDNYNFYSISNSGIIKITHPSFDNVAIQTIVNNGIIEGAGVIVTTGINGNYNGLYNDANVSINMSLVKHYAGVILNNNTYNSSGKYDNISSFNVGLNKKSTIFQAYNLGNIDVFSTNAIYHNWIKYSGVSVGKNIDFEEIRNEGYIKINATHSAPNDLLYGGGAVDGLSNPQKTMKINGVFEEVSQNRYAKNIYNGGRLSFTNSNTLYVFNLFISGIGYKNANTNMYADKRIDYTSVDFTPVEGSIHNAVNDGEIYSDSRIKGQSRMAGIVLINEGMLTSVANTGDIYNSNAIQSSANTGVNWEFEVETGGITFLMGSRYAQIRDSVNYGNIVSYGTTASTGNGWVNASGIATRNDKMENNTDASGGETYHYFAKIAFTINYGDVYSFNKRDSDGLNVGGETHNKASGILTLGLLSSINNLNYGNIYGKNLASGIYGFVFIDKFVKYGNVNDNEIFIASSVNYGKIRRIDSPAAFTYNGENLGISPNITQMIVQSERLPRYAFGALIGKVHTGGTTNWNFSDPNNNFSISKVAFSYLINFDSLVDVVGNNPTTIGDDNNIIANQITMYMATTKPNDTSLKPFQNIVSKTLDNGPNGIFNISFPLRTVPEVQNFITDQYISDFIQFIPKSKVNQDLLDKIDFSGISDNAGIYALSSSKGISNGLFMPDNIDLNKLNPVNINNGNPEADTTWQYNINTGGDSLYNKFFTKMKQLVKAVATTILDLEMYMVGNETLKLRNPFIDENKGLITYYVPTNSDLATSTTTGTYTTTRYTTTYVKVTPANGSALGATWIPHKDYPGTQGTWVGDFKYDGSSYVPANYFATNGIYNVTMKTSSSGRNDPYYQIVYNNNDFPFTYIYKRVNGNDPRYYINNATQVASGAGAYRKLNGGWFSRDYYEYVGPTTDETFMEVIEEETFTSSIFDNSAGFSINYEDESTFELAYRASFKYNDLVYPSNSNATILNTYGPYDENGNLYSGTTLIDSYNDHYGKFRVYSESYSPNDPLDSNPNQPFTYRDYKVLIKRVQPQSITAITGVKVDGVNSNTTFNNINNVSINNSALYKPGLSPSLEFNYLTNNVPNGTDLKPIIKLYDDLNNVVDSSLYTIEEGIVETESGFDENIAAFGVGSVKISFKFSDLMPSGNYRLETSLASDDLYDVHITKEMSNEAEFTEFEFNQTVYDVYGDSELVSYIPYGMFYNSTDLATKIVDFSDVESTILPSYLDSYSLSVRATLTNVDFSIYTYNTLTSQHEYRIIYTIVAEDGTVNTFTHRLIEEEPSSTITQSYKDGNEIAIPLNESSLLREEISFFRVEYDLSNMYLTNNNFIVVSSYLGNDPSNALINQAYFIDIINRGFEVDFDYSAAIGDYTYNAKFQQELTIYGELVTWEFDYETMYITKIASDVSNLTNITFISDTIYAGLNIIIDYELITEPIYVSYIDTPAIRRITTLPSSGISYNEYGDEQSFYVIGQVQKSDLAYYSPSFYLPTGSIIRKIIDENNAFDPSMQSKDLFDDFTFDIAGGFKYIQYRVYAEDYIINDPVYGNHYTDYFVSVQDITNNIYFNLSIIVDNSVLAFDFDKVFVTFNLYNLEVIQSSMSLFSYFNGTRTGSNEQFRSSMSGTYIIDMDLSEEYYFEIEFVSSGVNIVDNEITIPSELIPRRYDMILRIINNPNVLEWGQQDIIEYIPNL